MAMDSLIGQLFDNRYRIERRIGTGGMADVFLARDETLGRRVAIKILAERYAQDDAFLERFRREATAAAGLSHPNIVSVYDRGQTAGTSYIAMEYLNGPTLKDEITSRAPLPEAEVVNWATQALDALEFAHRQGVVHRDIKPHNMILTDEGRLKVTDFGIARAANAQQMTEVGSIVGTAQYLSPEQARGLDVGPQSDLYSMGIVLYEMLTGELPFNGDSAVEIAMKQVSDPPPSIRRKNRLVSEGLEQVVMRALSKDPALRHRSARQMADELRRVSRGGAVSSDTQMATRVLTGGAAAVEAYTGTQTSVLQPADAGTPPRGQAPGPRRSALPWVLVFILLLVSAAVGYVVYQQLGGSGVTVPTLTGSCDHAKVQLAGVGLKGRCQNKKSALDKKGQVIGSDPSSGSSADKNSTVTIFIGAGPTTATVPNVSGKSFSEATTILEGKGFKIGTTIQVNSPKQPVGNVVGTVPKIGSVQPVGTVIQLQVATGLVVVPDVKGLSCKDATAKMQQKTLIATCQDQSDPDVPANQAIGSQPTAAGGTVAQNSPITVLISTGPQQVTVPPVVGQNKNDAIHALQAVGLKAKIQPIVECTDPSLDKTVKSQDPAAGAQAPEGSFVTLVVYKFKPTDPSCVSPPPT